jgi:hypothetical protein
MVVENKTQKLELSNVTADQLYLQHGSQKQRCHSEDTQWR